MCLINIPPLDNTPPADMTTTSDNKSLPHSDLADNSILLLAEHSHQIDTNPHCTLTAFPLHSDCIPNAFSWHSRGTVVALSWHSRGELVAL